MYKYGYLFDIIKKPTDEIKDYTSTLKAMCRAFDWDMSKLYIKNNDINKWELWCNDGQIIIESVGKFLYVDIYSEFEPIHTNIIESCGNMFNGFIGDRHFFTRGYTW